MQCLILGGAGFIGSHVVEALMASGHKVRLLDRRPNPFWQPPAEAECVWQDWNAPETLDRALADVDVVIHLIGDTVPANSGRDLQHEVEANLTSTLRLLQHCAGRVRRIIYASSGGAVYGPAESLPIHEDAPACPISSYGILKLACERYVQLFHRTHGLEFVILRAANPYGERQNPHGPQGAISVFMQQMAHGQPIEIVGDGKIIRDYFYVGDLAEAYRAAVETAEQAAVLNVGSGQGLSLLDIIAELSVVTGMLPSVVHQPPRLVDVPANILDITRIRQSLHWEPKIALQDGLSRTWSWILRNP